MPNKRAAEAAPAVATAKRSKRAKKDPNKPKRAATAYNCFLSAHHARFKAEASGANQQVMRIAAIAWKGLDAAAKEPYEKQSAADRARHNTEMNSYEPPPPPDAHAINPTQSKQPVSAAPVSAVPVSAAPVCSKLRLSVGGGGGGGVNVAIVEIFRRCLDKVQVAMNSALDSAKADVDELLMETNSARAGSSTAAAATPVSASISVPAPSAALAQNAVPEPEAASAAAATGAAKQRKAKDPLAPKRPMGAYFPFQQTKLNEMLQHL